MATCKRLFVAAMALPLAPFSLAAQVKVAGRVELVVRSGKPADASSAVVWLTPLTDAGSATTHEETPRRTARIVQRGKHFEPHVLVVVVGSRVEFPNLDPFFHNVFSLFEGKRFDLGLYEAGTTRTLTFDRAGVCYLFCNIHPEMSAMIVVLATPYYTVSNRAGEFAISNVPAGKYRLEVWHERAMPQALKKVSREVALTEDVSSLGAVRIEASGDLTIAHTNKYGRGYDPPTPSSPLYVQP